MCVYVWGGGGTQKACIVSMLENNLPSAIMTFKDIFPLVTNYGLTHSLLAGNETKLVSFAVMVIRIVYSGLSWSISYSIFVLFSQCTLFALVDFKTHMKVIPQQLKLCWHLCSSLSCSHDPMQIMLCMLLIILLLYCKLYPL